MPKNIKEEILVLRLLGEEKAIVGMYRQKSFFLFFSGQGWLWQVRYSCGCKAGGTMCNLAKHKSGLWNDLSALTTRLQHPAPFWSQNLVFLRCAASGIGACLAQGLDTLLGCRFHCSNLPLELRWA